MGCCAGGGVAVAFGSGDAERSFGGEVVRMGSDQRRTISPRGRCWRSGGHCGRPALEKAKVIVSIDADLFHGEPLAIKYNRDFVAGRKLRDSKKAEEAEMNRLYVIETGFRLPVRWRIIGGGEAILYHAVCGMRGGGGQGRRGRMGEAGKRNRCLFE